MAVSKKKVQETITNVQLHSAYEELKPGGHNIYISAHMGNFRYHVWLEYPEFKPNAERVVFKNPIVETRYVKRTVKLNMDTGEGKLVWACMWEELVKAVPAFLEEMEGRSKVARAKKDADAQKKKQEAAGQQTFQALKTAYALIHARGGFELRNQAAAALYAAGETPESLQELIAKGVTE